MGKTRDTLARWFPIRTTDQILQHRIIKAIAEYQFAREGKPNVAPGSISVDTSMPSLLQIAGQFADAARQPWQYIRPLVDPRIVDALIVLSIENPLMSKTVYDAVTLANSGHTIVVEGNAAAKDAALKSLTELSLRMHPGGPDAWCSVAFYQALVVGALSHEWVVADDLRGLIRSKFVPTQSIRFKPDGLNQGIFLPYQVNGRVDGKEAALNTETYHYRPILQIENHPYAIPPYSSALEPLWVQRKTMEQVSGIVAKFGLLGLVSFAVQPPTQRPGETEDQYTDRCRAILATVETGLENSYTRGTMVSFKGTHEVKVDEVHAESRGFRDLWDTVDLQAHSALNNDPSLTGRPFSRTETQIRLVYQILTQQLANLQAIVGNSVASGYNLHLRLGGIPAVASMEWYPINTFDAKADAETQKIASERIVREFEAGLIDREEGRTALGYEESIESSPGAAAASQGASLAKWSFGKYREVRPQIDLVTRDEAQEVQAAVNWPPMDIPEGCDCGHDFGEAELSKASQLLDEYVRAIDSHVRDAGDVAMDQVRLFLRTGARQVSADQFSRELYRIIAQSFGQRMSNEQIRGIVEHYGDALYKEARLAGGFKEALQGFPDPRAHARPVFASQDARTVRFLQDTDFMYLGKFVNRDDTAARIQQRIMTEYIAVGRDWRDKNFVGSVARTLGLEYFQAERIIRTTATMSRNFAALRAFEQVGTDVVQQFEIMGPMDRLKCTWCRGMIGRRFSVQSEVNRMNHILALGPSRLPETKPILNSTLTTDELKAIPKTATGNAKLQSAGLALPSYHPNCRDRIVARQRI